MELQTNQSPPTQLPDWLVSTSSIAPTAQSPMDTQLAQLPETLPTVSTVSTVSNRPSKERMDLILKQFEVIFPRFIDMIYEGYTLNAAFSEFHYMFENTNGNTHRHTVNSGLFFRWVKKDPERYRQYNEAKEARTEVYAGKAIEHAEARGDYSMEEVARSRLVVDTYKFLMGADNKKHYGDTKSIEVTSTISITAALHAANARAFPTIDVTATNLDTDAIGPQDLLGENELLHLMAAQSASNDTNQDNEEDNW